MAPTPIQTNVQTIPMQQANLLYGPAAQQTAQAYGNPGTITNRIQNLVNGFNAPQQPMVAAGGNSGYIPSMAPNGAGRPVGSTVNTQRSQPVATAITGAYGTRTANQTAANQSLTDWTRDFLAQRPQAQQFAGQETDAIGRMYGSGPGSAQSDLARIRQNRTTAIRDMTEAAYRRAGRSNNMRRMGSGNSSYLDRLYAQDMGRIGSESAMQGADQERADMLYLDGQRTGLAGSRQQLMDQLLGREMMPTQMRSQVEGDSLGRLGQIAGLDYNNTNYEPAEDAYQRRIDWMQQLAAMGVQI